jgi:hypothetical protein
MEGDVNSHNDTNAQLSSPIAVGPSVLYPVL